MANSKNPLAYLKHIVKDPINTIAEADARKKEIMPLLYGSAGALAVGVILQVAAKLDFMVIFSVIGLAGVLFGAFLLTVIARARARFEALTCDKCNTLAEIKTPEAFAKYISYSILEDKAIYKGQQGYKCSPQDGVYAFVKFTASSSATVSVDLTCPHCGAVKHLEYHAEPLSCHVEKKKVSTLDYELVCSKMETAVKAVVDDYNNPEKKHLIPYTFHSSKNPNFEKRYTLKGANASGAHPDYMGVRIDYRKDVAEMLEHYFIFNELSGGLRDPAKAKK